MNLVQTLLICRKMCGGAHNVEFHDKMRMKVPEITILAFVELDFPVFNLIFLLLIYVEFEYLPVEIERLIVEFESTDVEFELQKV